MWSLILKIFLCYWIAAGLVIAVIDGMPHEQMHRPEATEALSSVLRIHARQVLAAYEQGGCRAAAPLLAGDAVNRMGIASPDGTVFCAPGDASGITALIRKAAVSNHPIAAHFRGFQVVAFKVSSMAGKPYILLLESRFTTADFFELVPGTTTIVISGVVTVLLALLIAVPIRRLRGAARDIANGKLDARFDWSGPLGTLARFPASDALNSLIVDFNQMAGRLESLVAAQRMLLRDVSHELRSPLARLSVALQFTRETAPGSMMVPLDRIEAEAGRLNGLIEQILSLSYMEAVQELSNCAEISLSDLVASIMPDIQYEASSRPCHVTSQTIQDSTVHGDPDLLQRALENVVRNAMRYTPQEGMIEIEVDRAGGEHAEMAILRVKDNGPGVPSDELESILRPFYRVDKSRQRSTGGFGVGLAIADRAVHLHAGNIRASNRPQGGLLVEMTFPASPGAPNERND